MIAIFALTLLSSAADAIRSSEVTILGVRVSTALPVRVLLRAAGFAGLVLLFAGVYLALPVGRISRRRAFIGGLSAAVLWRAVGILLSSYFATLSMVNLLYGSLATVVVVLLLLEGAFIILLLGAQVIAELEASAAAGVPWHQPPPP
jgi:membrane protein